jgi:DNA-directed RNA polymerase specialized sigma24 family protein
VEVTVAAGHPDLSRESLERLLGLLDPEREAAARRYQQLRRRLIRLFEWRGARFPDDLADETISRVARRLDDGVEIRSEDPFRYFCGVAHLVFKEVLRERKRDRVLQDPASWPPTADEEPESDDERMVVLQECLGKLGDEQRTLILEYHEGEKRERIENRRALADRLGIELNALRIRVHRTRLKLERCVRRRVRNET